MRSLLITLVLLVNLSEAFKFERTQAGNITDSILKGLDFYSTPNATLCKQHSFETVNSLYKLKWNITDLNYPFLKLDPYLFLS